MGAGVSDLLWRRDVDMNNVPELGKLIDGVAARDAIHVAVAPVTAGQSLLPGQHVGLTNGVALFNDDPIGIVDPFLTEAVEQGQRFWLLIYPGTITGLRHVFSHPAFAPKTPETKGGADHAQ